MAGLDAAAAPRELVVFFVWSPLKKPFIHIPSQQIGNQLETKSKNNRCFFYHSSFEMVNVNKSKTRFKSTMDSNPFFVPLRSKFPLAIKTSIKKRGVFSEKNPGGFIAPDCDADENVLVLNHSWLFSARTGRWSALTSDKP